MYDLYRAIEKVEKGQERVKNQNISRTLEDWNSGKEKALSLCET